VIVALVGQKGGSGKSTLAVCIAVELAERGHKVLLVDSDPQQTAVTWHDVAAEAKHHVPSVIAMTGSLHRENQLPSIAEGYTDVVIDTPPRLGEVQRSALMVADVALLPCGPSGPDAWALAESIRTVTEARDYRPDLQAAIVINKKRSQTSLSKGARQALSDTGLPVLTTEISFRQAFQDALTAGLGVTKYARRNPAADEIRALVGEVMKFSKGMRKHEQKAGSKRKSA
jgi:chromosome partitioning protein